MSVSVSASETASLSRRGGPSVARDLAVETWYAGRRTMRSGKLKNVLHTVLGRFKSRYSSSAIAVELVLAFTTSGCLLTPQPQTQTQTQPQPAPQEELRHCDSLLFSRPTDTVQIAGNTRLQHAATYEAVVRIHDAAAPDGLLFNEWQGAAEDKQLTMGAHSLWGYAFRVSPPDGPGGVVGSLSIADERWHHVAYVYDGAEERTYLDAQLIFARPAAGNVANGDASLMSVGAMARDGGIRQGFSGYVRALRISSVARYVGQQITVPKPPFASGPGTELNFDFTELSPSGMVRDLSGNGHAGTLGAGFGSATAPICASRP